MYKCQNNLAPEHQNVKIITTALGLAHVDKLNWQDIANQLMRTFLKI